MNRVAGGLGVSAVMAALLPSILSAAEPATSPAATGWKQPRTPWGDPDLRGTWPVVHLISVPLERAERYGERLHFTAQELVEQRQALEARNTRYENEDAENRIGMGHWAEMTDLPPQTSLIIDPPNGRLPPLTEAGKALSARMGSSWNRDLFDSVADFDTWDRCITRGMPASMFPFQYNNGIQVLQTPGYVVINMEMVHEARIIPVGDVAPVDSSITQWLGVSRGRWEGNVLIVETTNFNGQTSTTSAGTGTGTGPRDPRAASTQLKVTEKFERTGDDTLTYTVTVDDPVTQTRSWTAQLPWRRDDSYQFFEYACHEDNEHIRNYITSSRAQRARDAAQK